MAKALAALGQIVVLGLMAGSFLCLWVDIDNQIPIFKIKLGLTSVKVDYPKPDVTDKSVGGKLKGGLQLATMAVDAATGDKSWAMIGFDGVDSFNALGDKACNSPEGKVAEFLAKGNTCTQARAIQITSYVSIVFLGLGALMSLCAAIQAAGMTLAKGKPRIFAVGVVTCYLVVFIIEFVNGMTIKSMFDADNMFRPGPGMILAGIANIFAIIVCLMSGGEPEQDPALLNKGDVEAPQYGANGQAPPAGGQQQDGYDVYNQPYQPNQSQAY